MMPWRGERRNTGDAHGTSGIFVFGNRRQSSCYSPRSKASRTVPGPASSLPQWRYQPTLERGDALVQMLGEAGSAGPATWL
jgi:hypothetical protein